MPWIVASSTTHELHNDERRKNHIVGLLRLPRQLRRPVSPKKKHTSLAQQWLREWHLRARAVLPIEWTVAAVAQADGFIGKYEPLNSADAKS
jgi:hypothetical protein